MSVQLFLPFSIPIIKQDCAKPLYTVNDKRRRKRSGESCLFNILDSNCSKKNPSRMASHYWSSISRSLLHNVFQVKSSSHHALQAQEVSQQSQLSSKQRSINHPSRRLLMSERKGKGKQKQKQTNTTLFCNYYVPSSFKNGHSKRKL